VEREKQWPKEKCTRQSAQIAVRNAKFRSNPTRADQSTAESVGQKEEAAEDDKRILTS
jgi:hypothetical protein